MWRALIAVLCVAALAALAGCGGGSGSPTVLAGNYFPHGVGASWTFNLTTAVESDLVDFHGTGTITNTVLRQEDIPVDGTTLTCYVIGSTFTVDSAPTAADGLVAALRPYVDQLFSTTDGGLRPVEYYYHSYPPVTGSTSRRETLVAVKYGTDPRIDLATPRLHFSNPPLSGNASTGTVPLLARPLSPSADLVSDAAAFDKVRDFGDLDGPLGNRHTAIYIDRYEGNLNCNGDPCAFSGRARSYLQQGVGLMWAEWALTLNKGGAWARVSFTTANPTYTP